MTQENMVEIVFFSIFSLALWFSFHISLCYSNLFQWIPFPFLFVKTILSVRRPCQQTSRFCMPRTLSFIIIIIHLFNFDNGILFSDSHFCPFPFSWQRLHLNMHWYRIAFHCLSIVLTCIQEIEQNRYTHFIHFIFRGITSKMLSVTLIRRFGLFRDRKNHEEICRNEKSPTYIDKMYPISENIGFLG